ncbi:MAG: phosphoribosylanthranilate isomerase [Cyclobacteriaceae bacterium]
MFKNKPISLKICGMRDSKNILEVVSLHPEYMGFIFYEKSPRYVGSDFSIPTGFPKTIKRVGVFVNEQVEIVKAVSMKHQLDYVQLHGHESVAECNELKQAGIGVIKVFSMDAHFDFKTTIPFENCVDYFLFDTKGKFYGGNAATFDWSLLKSYNQRIPFFLSGGLSAENISSITQLDQMNLHAIDVNSGVEISVGMKSVDKIKRVQNNLKALAI